MSTDVLAIILVSPSSSCGYLILSTVMIMGMMVVNKLKKKFCVTRETFPWTALAPTHMPGVLSL